MVRKVNMMFLARYFLISAAVVTALLTSCANESSNEDRKREDNERQFNRLKLADGYFFGYVEISDNQIVPLGLDLTTTRNPVNGDDSPALSAAMRIGLFGGVTMSSRAASFDWGSGRLSISFEKQAGIGSGSSESGASGPTSRGALELRGIMRDGDFVEAVIDGPNRGIRRVSLTKNGAKLFSDRAAYRYQVSFRETIAGTSRTTISQMELKPLIETHMAPLTSELPMLAAYDASFKFPGTAIVPQTVNDVIYDPLDGYIELRLRENSKIRVENVALTKESISLGIDLWKPASPFIGSIIEGATAIGSATFESGFPGLGLAEPAPLAELPPKYYKGIYKTPQNPQAFPAVASLEYMNSQGTNSAEYPFAYFPKFRLKVLICSGGRPYKENTYEMIALDQMAGTARLWDIRQGSNSGADIGYSTNWEEIVARFTTSSSGTIDPRDPQLKLQSQGSDGAVDCSDTKKPR